MANVARLDWLAKAGYTARGLVYILFGYLALQTRSGAAKGKDGVFDAITEMPAGGLLITLTAIGLLAYGCYRLACAILDTERKGNEPKGLVARGAQFFSGLIHLVLAYSATQFASGEKSKASATDGQATQEASSSLLDKDLGEAGLWVIAIILLLAAARQFQRAIKTDHMKHLSSDAPAFACNVGRAGLAARGLIFAVIGWSFITAAQSDSGDEAKGMGTALASLSETGWLYTAVAIGLILFGVFSLIQARYRIVPPVDVVHAAKDKVSHAGLTR